MVVNETNMNAMEELLNLKIITLHGIILTNLICYWLIVKMIKRRKLMRSDEHNAIDLEKNGALTLRRLYTRRTQMQSRNC